MPTLGYVDLRSPQRDPRGTVAALQDGLREVGYVEGQNIHVEYRFAEGREERLPALFAELIRLNVDILLTPGTVVTAAAQRAMSTIPIIMTAGDPVGSGFVASLARPGGIITGLSLAEDPRFATKRLELLKEAAPQIARVGYLRNAANAISSGDALGWNCSGGLMSYGPALVDMWRQTPVLVGKILHDARPADLPVAQPTRFESSTSRPPKPSGWTIPRPMLLRADEVIR